MVLFNDIIKIEEKYRKMNGGVSVVLNKIEKNDAIKTMKSCFKLFLKKNGVNSTGSDLISEAFAFDLVIFAEAMEKERKERFFDFVSSVFSKEFLKGKEEKLLYKKILKRMVNKSKKEEKLKIINSINLNV